MSLFVTFDVIEDMLLRQWGMNCQPGMRKGKNKRRSVKKEHTRQTKTPLKGQTDLIKYKDKFDGPIYIKTRKKLNYTLKKNQNYRIIYKEFELHIVYYKNWYCACHWTRTHFRHCGSALQGVLV